jgi:hypothetical protein
MRTVPQMVLGAQGPGFQNGRRIPSSGMFNLPGNVYTKQEQEYKEKLCLGPLSWQSGRYRLRGVRELRH